MGYSNHSDKQEVKDKRLFVHKEIKRRRHFPVIYVQLGVLGDLCLTRINKEIFDYSRKASATPFHEIYLCDIVDSPSNSSARFLSYLYQKCRNFQCIDLYFSKDITKEIEERNREDGITGDDTSSLDYFTEKCDSELIYINSDNKKLLTTLGWFLFNNYRRTKTDDDWSALCAERFDEADWIFYFAIPPRYYKDVLGTVVKHFYDSEGKPFSSPGTAKVILLEKPLQNTSNYAEDLSCKVNEYIDKLVGLHVFAVDHYAAKFTLAEIPILMQTHPDFANFVFSVDEIVIELLEEKEVPDFRLEYMAPTGLYFDMMPHALVPLQMLFAGMDIEYKASIINVGYYNGYVKKVGNWSRTSTTNKNSKEKSVKYETYFSIKLDLKVSKKGKKKSSEPRHVIVFIRAGKAMNVERKRVILKRRINKQVAALTINIKEDCYETTADVGVTLPHYLTDKNEPKKFIRGYARILLNLMQFLNSLPASDSTKQKRTPETVLELMKVDKAASVIKNIETIQDQLDWPSGDSELTEYPPHEVYVVSREKEKMFVSPYTL